MKTSLSFPPLPASPFAPAPKGAALLPSRFSGKGPARLLLFIPLLLGLSGCSKITMLRTQELREAKKEVQVVGRKVDTLQRVVDDLSISQGGTTSKMRADLTAMLGELQNQLTRLHAEMDETQFRLNQLNQKLDRLEQKRIIIQGGKIDSASLGQVQGAAPGTAGTGGGAGRAAGGAGGLDGAGTGAGAGGGAAGAGRGGAAGARGAETRGNRDDTGNTGNTGNTGRSPGATPGTGAGAASGGSAGTGDPAPGGTPQVRVVQGLDLENLYNQARDDFFNGRYELAYKSFQTVYEKDPSGGYKENALYWMGESLLKGEKTDKSIEIFERLLKEFPRGNKLCPTRFKLGLLHERKGATAKRDEEFKRLIGDCPGSNEAQRAEALMKG